MIKSMISDLRNGNVAHLNTENNLNGLIVDTRPLKTFQNRVLFLTNNMFGDELAQDATPSGTPLGVHNGIDTVLWTASILLGPNRFVFNSTIQAHTGTRSISCVDTRNNDSFQVLNTTNINSHSYSSLDGWIRLGSVWTVNVDGISVFMYDTALGIQVSQTVNIRNYINGSSTNVWQKFSIPITDFGPDVSFNALRFVFQEDGASANLYLDDIELTTGSGNSPLIYEVKAEVGKWLHVEKFTFTYIDEYGTVGLLHDIPYDSLFGVPRLENGLIYNRIQENETRLTIDIHSHIDLMSFGIVEHLHHGFDGTNSWVSIIASSSAPLILKPEFDDRLRFVLSDNLIGLKSFKISVSCREETRCVIC